MPAWVARTSTLASSAATLSANRGEPLVVTVPAASKRSFHEIGTPSSGPRERPWRALSPAAPASARARSAVARM